VPQSSFRRPNERLSPDWLTGQKLTDGGAKPDLLPTPPGGLPQPSSPTGCNEAQTLVEGLTIMSDGRLRSCILSLHHFVTSASPDRTCDASALHNKTPSGSLTAENESLIDTTRRNTPIEGQQPRCDFPSQYGRPTTLLYYPGPQACGWQQYEQCRLDSTCR
jgi:hypothetical protein